jgi:hypothetical protein
MSLPAASPPRAMTRSERRTLRIRPHGGPPPVRSRTVWAPVSLLWLLTPLALLAFPFVAVLCWAWRIDAFALAGRLAGLVASLPGTEVAVEGRRSNLRIKLV